MDILDGVWLNTTIALMQRFCVITTFAYIALRFKTLRRALLNIEYVLLGIERKWQYIFFTALFFAFFALISIWNGLLFTNEIQNWESQTYTIPNDEDYIIINSCNGIVLAAGLTGGVSVGLGVGLVAGLVLFYEHRNNPFAFTSTTITTMTVLLGLASGLVKFYFTKKTKSVKRTLIVAFVLITYQYFILILLNRSLDIEIFVPQIIIPSWLANYGGFVLFTLFISDLEYDRLRNEARRAMLRSLHAQVEPHFLNNTLSSIQSLTRTQPEKACSYLSKLACFFSEMRKNAPQVAITVEQELIQVQHYMDFQQLRFEENISFSITVPNRLLHYDLPPCSLLTLVENALTHARADLTRPLSIVISGEESTNNVRLHVWDNGCGINPERLALLTKQIVTSEFGSGTALYYLNQSLLMAYSGKAELTIESTPGKGTLVTLIFPKELIK